MTSRRKKWGLREWGVFFTTAIAGITLATILVRWVFFGATWANGWVDTRATRVAQKVVGDSLGQHRDDGHDRRAGRRHR